MNKERWEIVEADTRGNPRQIVIHEPDDEQPIIITDQQQISPIPPAMPKATSHIEGSWSDRARAFNLSTLNLSLITGGLFVVTSIAMNGAVLPILALSLYFFSGFALTWLISFTLYIFVSAEGSQFVETLMLWKYLYREQSERHRRYGAPPRQRDRIREIGDRIFAAFLIIWLVLGFISWLYVRG